jgi:4-hydroxy-tetrahydrodipicolinate reductase
MTRSIKIAVTGCSGRMGQTVLQCLLEKPDVELTAALEHSGHSWVGRSLQDVSNLPYEVVVTSDIKVAFQEADVVIDFTRPEASLDFAKAAVAYKTALVIGTTGFSEGQFETLKKYAEQTPILQAGNMSFGVNMLTMLTQQVSQALGEDFDIEIIEAHHNKKVDAPSGTALMLGEAAARGRGVSLKEVSDYARHGITGERKSGDIGFSVVRGGDIVGEHDVMFIGAGERVILRHIATDRKIFGRGAVKAAYWIAGKESGFFSINDCLLK